MQKGVGFIDQYHTGVTGHDFRDDAGECLHAVARFINYLSGGVESDSVCVDTSLLDVVSRSSIGKPDAQLPQIGWVQNKVPTESVEHDSPHFVSLGVVSEKHLKAALGRALKIASSLLAHEAYSTASIKHQR